MIVSLGAMFSEQSGVMNIGLEGIMIIGAFSGIMAINALEGSLPPQALLFCGVLVSMLAGIVFTFLTRLPRSPSRQTRRSAARR